MWRLYISLPAASVDLVTLHINSWSQDLFLISPVSSVVIVINFFFSVFAFQDDKRSNKLKSSSFGTF